MRIIFVRHAESENNARDIVNLDTELTEKGHEQAVLLAQYIATKNPDYILSSQRVKTLQVAEHISAATGVEVVATEQLWERNRGDRGGYPWEDVENILNGMSIEERYTFVPPNGESWEHMEKRLLKTLDNLAQLGKKCAVVITHKSCMRSLMRVLLKGELDDHAQFSVGMASCTIVSYNNGEYDLESRNELSHLGEVGSSV